MEGNSNEKKEEKKRRGGVLLAMLEHIQIEARSEKSASGLVKFNQGDSRWW